MPDANEVIWRAQEQAVMDHWCLYTGSGIVYIAMSGFMVYILTDRQYPLTQETLKKLFSKKLQVDAINHTAFEFLRFLFTQLHQQN